MGTKPETASRVRQRIAAVLDYTTTLNFRSGENPARWKGNLENILAQTSKIKNIKHHPALDYRELPEFMYKLSKRIGISARALEFLIVTVVRSGEVRGALWQEIDIASKIWIIPAERIKSRKEHRIPLSDQMIRSLGEIKKEGFIFEGKQGNMLSNNSLAKVLKSMKYNNVTVHGFRSTFRDWAGETTSFPREVIEHVLAHQLKDKTEAAYARGTLINKRRELMEAWEKYCYRCVDNG